MLLVCTVYSTVLYSEIALSRKPFGIGHMYIYTCLLRMTDRTMTFLPGTLYTYIPHLPMCTSTSDHLSLLDLIAPSIFLE
jgi:hypothetical protein